jgi:oxepin-CoA hydrolase/3-oxo-5,6-dehydrosuberyl-CoA semialdehyde dehydrogenase
MQTLPSFVLGSRHLATGGFQSLENPVTEELVAQASSAGLDYAQVVRFGREVGGRHLRALTFAERGALLAKCSAAIHAQRDALIELSRINGGTTRGDGKFDIDGATGTLTFYASLGEKFGARTHLVDGESVQLGRTARHSGLHVRVSRPGVAVHINAFNFPAWGMMEKFACSILAGVPVIEKPGTPTAMLAARIAELIVEANIMPEGSFQFVCGSLGDMLDHLGPHDVLAFTGSSATGAKLRGNANLVRQNVHVTLECDSLNAAVLAPDVEESSETYALFLRNVALDMTQKTGQKCTAVRRIFVPKERAAQVQADLVDALSRIPVGDPADEKMRMGPVASKAQFEDVSKGIARLAAHGTVACGGAARLYPKGWFLAPTLIVARDAADPAHHAEEVFGPCASLLPYEGDATAAAALVNKGGGGLVCSAYSNDAAWSERFTLEAAPWHGRVWLASDKNADQALPPGMVLPHSIHGGPGRAGGGEELGAERGLELYMQRTAVQGFKGMLDALLPKQA